MKRLQKKLRSRRGMTMTELLMALLVLALLSTAIVAGTNAAMRVYQKSVTVSEAQTLTSALLESLSDELRYAQNIRMEGEGESAALVFDSQTFGPGVSVLGAESDGVIRLGNSSGKSYELLSAKAYTSGLQAQAEVEYNAADRLFQITVTVQNSWMEPRKTTLKVKALNS